jgi:hypothetical protein
MRGPMVGNTDEELFDIAEAVHQTSGGTELYPVRRNRKSLRQLAIGRFCGDFAGIGPLFRSPGTLAVSG